MVENCSKSPFITKLQAEGVGVHPPILAGTRIYTYTYVILPLLVPLIGTYRNRCKPVVALLKFIVVDEEPLVADKVEFAKDTFQWISRMGSMAIYTLDEHSGGKKPFIYFYRLDVELFHLRPIPATYHQTTAF